MSDDALPLCACEQYYESHHPECPARRAHEAALLKLDEYEHRAKLHMDRCQHDMERIVALEQQNEALASRLGKCLEAFRSYGRHHHDCKVRADRECSCGYHAAYDEVFPRVVETPVTDPQEAMPS